jgi:hypothetical protein
MGNAYSEWEVCDPGESPLACVMKVRCQAHARKVNDECATPNRVHVASTLVVMSVACKRQTDHAPKLSERNRVPSICKMGSLCVRCSHSLTCPRTAAHEYPHSPPTLSLALIQCSYAHTRSLTRTDRIVGLTRICCGIVLASAAVIMVCACPPCMRSHSPTRRHTHARDHDKQIRCVWQCEDSPKLCGAPRLDTHRPPQAGPSLR